MLFGSDEIRQDNGYGYGENIDININNSNFNDNVNDNMNMNTYNDPGFAMGNTQMMNIGTIQGPIIEPGRERVIQRNIVHEVKHVCPMNTKIINNHIFKHTYQPHYTCCEENTVTNVQCGSCCNFN